MCCDTAERGIHVVSSGEATGIQPEAQKEFSAGKHLVFRGEFCSEIRSEDAEDGVGKSFQADGGFGIPGRSKHGVRGRKCAVEAFAIQHPVKKFPLVCEGLFAGGGKVQPVSGTSEGEFSGAGTFSSPPLARSVDGDDSGFVFPAILDDFFRISVLVEQIGGGGGFLNPHNDMISFFRCSDINSGNIHDG